MDEGTKQEQVARLNKSPVAASLVVETKRGYQVYWNAKPGASQERWNDVMINRIVPYFGADPNARDVARILRAPGYYHMKDPSDPFMVKVVYQRDVAYTEDQMLRVFPDASKPKAPRQYKSGASGNGFWDAVFNIDCQDALTRLSGSPMVSYEKYDFRRNGNGTMQILVNGKSTGNWIDVNGKLGSLDHGGPSIIQWLMWFGNNTHKEIAEAMKILYPELRNVK